MSYQKRNAKKKQAFFVNNEKGFSHFLRLVGGPKLAPGKVYRRFRVILIPVPLASAVDLLG